MKREAISFAYCCAAPAEICDCVKKDHGVAYDEVADDDGETDTENQVHAAYDRHLAMHRKADEEGHYW